MAFEIVWADVLAVVKDAVANAKLAAFSEPDQDVILEETECYVPETYGKLTKTLRRYWAAHVAVQTIVEPAGDGAFTSESIGSVNSSKNQPVNNPQADQGHLETAYGRTFHVLRENFMKTRIISFGIFSGGRIEGVKKDTPL